MQRDDSLFPRHGAYRKLKSFRIAQLVYDVMVRICDRYIDKRSRTHDQMVQAARSGVQNIAEGSQMSGTSKKMEMELTNVARAGLEELRLDYEDFLRQRGLENWGPEHPILKRFKVQRRSTLEGLRRWVWEKVGRVRRETASVEQGRTGQEWDTEEKRSGERTRAEGHGDARTGAARGRI